MVSDKIYDLCKPILEDEALGEEEKTDQLEELLSSAPTSLKGKALEDAVLGSLWQWKSATDKTSSPRNATVIRSKSPAPWIQRAVTPGSGTASPRPSSAAPVGGPRFLARTNSSTQSPFSSPRNSPRLAVATPAIPHSPRLSAYQFADSSPATENYGDYGSDTVDWLVNDDTSSNTSFGDAGFGSEFMSPYTTEMSPYDMLRSILQDNRTDEELESLLEANGYDLGQTVNSIMELQPAAVQADSSPATYLIGKNMSPSSRPLTPAGQFKSPIVCRYWLASGHCARADCRFAHETQNHVCKYWLQGNCIAGNSCLFSHDPTSMMQQLGFTNSGNNTPQQFPPNFQLQDYDSFPALHPTTSNPYDETTNVDPTGLAAALQQQALATQITPAHLFPSFVPTGPRHGSKPNSRPGSRHTSRSPAPNQPNIADDEAFPSLGSAAATKPTKRHHGKRGGHGPASTTPSNLADIVRSSPSPGPNSREAMRRGLRANKSFTSTSSRENSAAAMAIPAPTEIPWLETGERVNTAYLKARSEAFKHGGLRNKFLQSAAQAWNRNDARGAKALSLRGQNENSLMREKHREAARVLYEERNSGLGQGQQGREVYVDLHGLHPEEAVAYLAACLKEQKAGSRPVYAICGTGHHSKNGKDKVGRAVRGWLNEGKFAFREFGVPGDRGNVGGILGIDPSSFERSRGGAPGGMGEDGDSGVGLPVGEDTKVVVVREDPRKVSAESS